MKPFILAQLSDPHIGATWAEADPLGRLRASVAAVRQLPDRPDAVVVSGDLADHGTVDEYELVRTELDNLRLPVFVIPGNHDNRAQLRCSFELPAKDTDCVDYAVDLGPMLLIMIDSTIPGGDCGDLDERQLAWLEKSLQAAPERPTLLVMHHPPVRTGIAAFDAIVLVERARADLQHIISRHTQVKAILTGHLHRTFASRVACCVALTAASTYSQLAVNPSTDELSPVGDEPPAFLVHRFLGDQFVSYTQNVFRD
jgi:3',5'-cyclic AMP phosphodiesterase CpdA